MYFYYSSVYSTIQNVTEPGLRGTAMAIYFLAMYLLGASFGPYVIGSISDYFTQQAAIAAGVSDFSPQRARTVSRRRTCVRQCMSFPIFSTLLTLVLFAASRTVKDDVEKLQNWMREVKEEVNP